MNEDAAHKQKYVRHRAAPATAVHKSKYDCGELPQGQMDTNDSTMLSRKNGTVSPGAKKNKWNGCHEIFLFCRMGKNTKWRFRMDKKTRKKKKKIINRL